MKLALLYDPWLLEHRRASGFLDFQNIYTDSRGLTGSEYGLARLAEEFVKLGHEVHVFTRGTHETGAPTNWRGAHLRPWDERGTVDTTYDTCISLNIPDALRSVAARFRATIFWLNNYTFCKVGFQDHCDLFIGPSEPHRQMALNHWKDVEGTAAGFLGRYDAEPEKWTHTPLGCDPEQYGKQPKIPGRVIYCSSPDRGLDHLMSSWRDIKAAVPHATLHIFYRLQPWIDQILAVDPNFAPMREIREKALKIDAAIKQFSGDGSITIRDAVSRQQIEIEQSRAEVLAYPCDTPIWSEGWSCSVHECCVAKACPVVTDCDAFKEVYGEFLPMVQRGAPNWVQDWRNLVIRALTDKEFRDGVNAKAHAWAKDKTWEATARNMLDLIEARRTALGRAA
jgi:hypothetical protein